MTVESRDQSREWRNPYGPHAQDILFFSELTVFFLKKNSKPIFPQTLLSAKTLLSSLKFPVLATFKMLWFIVI